MTGPIVVLGDSLLDLDIEGDADRLCPDAPVPVVVEQGEHPRPGGAGLAALLAARDGAEVILITALGDDAAGQCLDGILSRHVSVMRLPLRGSTIRKTRIRARGQTLLRVDAGDGRARRLRTNTFAAVLRDAGAILVSDYGHGVAEICRNLLPGLRAPIIWDPHPRGGPPFSGCALVTPSEAEARVLCAQPYTTPERLARSLVRDLDVEAVALTLGGSGAALARRSGRFARIPSPTLVTAGDTCGAGDRFAASVAVALVDGSSIEDAVVMAVGEATRFVEQGGAAAIRVPEPASSPPISSLIVSAAASSLSRPFSGVCERIASTDPAFDVASRIRKSGGRLIATGGCFDLLHAGHVSLLRRARALGDLLIVCVNSDESIRRLKGPNRPVVAQQDRVEVLRALGCVDAVVLFEKDDPSELIERLRPDVWVKGGDYAARALPEAAAVHQVGGEIVVLPSLPGYSTTGLIAAIQAS